MASKDDAVDELRRQVQQLAELVEIGSTGLDKLSAEEIARAAEVVELLDAALLSGSTELIDGMHAGVRWEPKNATDRAAAFVSLVDQWLRLVKGNRYNLAHVLGEWLGEFYDRRFAHVTRQEMFDAISKAPATAKAPAIAEQILKIDKLRGLSHQLGHPDRKALEQAKRRRRNGVKR